MGWIALAIGLLALILFTLLDTAKREDRVARHAEKSADSFSDVDITVAGAADMSPGVTLAPLVDRPGGCYRCVHFGHRVDAAVWCARPGGEHVRMRGQDGCAYWECEPDADFDALEEPWAP
jgi:hypothetical protein